MSLQRQLSVLEATTTKNNINNSKRTTSFNTKFEHLFRINKVFKTNDNNTMHRVVIVDKINHQIVVEETTTNTNKKLFRLSKCQQYESNNEFDFIFKSRKLIHQFEN